MAMTFSQGRVCCGVSEAEVLLVDESSSAKQGATQLRAIATVSNLSFGFINRDFEKVDK
jgi:hypothetical protein